jgi:hypothetical protein
MMSLGIIIFFQPVSLSLVLIHFFQMTISESHPIKMQKMKDIVENAGLMALYFVFDSFTMQNFAQVTAK